MDLIAQTTDAGGTSGFMLFFWLAFVVLYIVGGWKTFEKAGQPGWAVLIPFYNFYIMLKIVGRPGWWLVLYFVPFVNFVIIIIVLVDLAKSFGKGIGFALGLIIFFPVFLMILGFGDARYVGPAAATGGSTPPPPPMPA